MLKARLGGREGRRDTAEPAVRRDKPQVRPIAPGSPRGGSYRSDAGRPVPMAPLWHGAGPGLRRSTFGSAQARRRTQPTRSRRRASGQSWPTENPAGIIRRVRAIADRISSPGTPQVLDHDNQELMQGCRMREPPMTIAHFAAFHSPIVLPSGSANQAKVPFGIVTGGTRVLPPSDSAFAKAAGTSSTST
jgi:hypothetical protein